MQTIWHVAEEEEEELKVSGRELMWADVADVEFYSNNFIEMELGAFSGIHVPPGEEWVFMVPVKVRNKFQ